MAKKSSGSVLPLPKLLEPKDVTVNGMSYTKPDTVFNYTVNGETKEFKLVGTNLTDEKIVTPQQRLALEKFAGVAPDSYASDMIKWEKGELATQPKLTDAKYNLSTDDLNYIQRQCTEWNIPYDPKNVNALQKMQTYSEPIKMGTEIYEDATPYAYRIAKGEQIDGQISQVTGRMDDIRGKETITDGVTKYEGGLIQKNQDEIIAQTKIIGDITRDYPDIETYVNDENAVANANLTAQTNLLNFENSTQYTNALKQERWLVIDQDETLSEDDKIREKLKLTMPSIVNDETLSEFEKQKEVINKFGHSDELYYILRNDDSKSQEEIENEVNNLYKSVVSTTTPTTNAEYLAVKETHNALKTEVENAKTLQEKTNEYIKAYGKISEKEKENSELRSELEELGNAKTQLQQEKETNQTEKQMLGLDNRGTNSKLTKYNNAKTAAEEAGKPKYAQGSGSGSFATPGQTINSEATYYSIKRDETNGTYTISGNLSKNGKIFDIERCRYYQSDESHRIGYTLLSCGNYSGNVYNNAQNNDGKYNQLNEMSFILPMPEGNVQLATKVNWREDSETGLNEAMQKMVSNGAENVISAGMSKLIQQKVLEVMGNYGGRGVTRASAIAYNPNNQLYFEGVALDSFNMTFQLVPKNAEESQKIKIFAEAINMIMLPGTSDNGSNINLLSSVGSALSAATSGKDGFLNTILGSVVAKGISGIGKIVGDTTGLSSPYFSYPALWSIGVYVPTATSSSSDFCILERNRLAMTSCDLTFGGNNGITWHPDGFPTVMKLTLSFQETQYRTRENMANLVSLLGGQNRFADYQDVAKSSDVKANVNPTKLENDIQLSAMDYKAQEAGVTLLPTNQFTDKNGNALY